MKRTKEQLQREVSILTAKLNEANAAASVLKDKLVHANQELADKADAHEREMHLMRYASGFMFVFEVHTAGLTHEGRRYDPTVLRHMLFFRDYPERDDVANAIEEESKQPQCPDAPMGIMCNSILAMLSDVGIPPKDPRHVVGSQITHHRTKTSYEVSYWNTDARDTNEQARVEMPGIKVFLSIIKKRIR